MKRRHERNVAEGLKLAPQLADAAARSQQSFHGRRAQRHQNLGADQINLRQQIRQAGFHFLGRGSAVAGGLAGGVGTALEDIGDINSFPAQTHRLDNACQQLARRAHKRLALRVFVRPGRFADKHQSRVNIPHAKNHILPAFDQVRTLQAGRGPLAQLRHGALRVCRARGRLLRRFFKFAQFQSRRVCPIRLLRRIRLKFNPWRRFTQLA